MLNAASLANSILPFQQTAAAFKFADGIDGRHELPQPKAVGIIKDIVSDLEQKVKSLMRKLLANSSVEELGYYLSGLHPRQL